MEYYTKRHAGPPALYQALESAVDEIKSSLGRKADLLMLDKIGHKLEAKLLKLQEIPLLAHYLTNLQSHDEYTVRHSIGVALISWLIGRAEGFDENQIRELTTGAALHDIGKTQVPREILQKPGSLSKEEYERVKCHVEFGFEMLRKVEYIPRSAAIVALQHHEREDGGGYPYGLHGHEIHPFSKIIAVADVLHSMISKRPYKDPVPLYKVLKDLSQNTYGSFEPRAVLCTLRTFMEMLIGSQVRLSEAMDGTLVMVHPEDPLHPVVEVRGEVIDLRQRKNLFLENIF